MSRIPDPDPAPAAPTPDHAGRPIVVIGSINLDLVCRTPRMPGPGETILGSDLLTVPGGKGANQAVAAAKLGGQVHFIGRVGDDDFGQRLLNGLQQHKVDTKYVTVCEGTASGCAVVLVDGKGENSIVVTPGANHRLVPADIDAAEELLKRAAVVLLQLEVPPETVEHALRVCRRVGAQTLLDPAPVPPDGLPSTMLDVDLLVPNQGEAEALLGSVTMGRMRRTRRVDAKQITADLLALGPAAVIMKLGQRGAVFQDRGGRIEEFHGYKVDVADTTAAGDAFAGALAVALAEGRKLREAIRFANAAGALCCESFGAQPALPTREAVEKLMDARH